MSSKAAQEAAAVMAAPMIALLRTLGVPQNLPGRNPRPAVLRDVQDIPTAAGTVVEFFNTATSSATLHPQGYAGCNLQEVGRTDSNTYFFPVFIGLTPVDDYAIDVSAMQDAQKLLEFGFIKEVRVNSRDTRLEPLPFAECATNKLAVANLHGAGATALATGQTWMDPARNTHGRGFQIPQMVPELFTQLKPDTPIAFHMEHKATSVLHAAFSLKCEVWGIRSDK